MKHFCTVLQIMLLRVRFLRVESSCNGFAQWYCR